MIGLIIAAIALIQPSGEIPVTPTPSPPTPATPIVVALRDLEIRDGQGKNFSRLNILPVNGSLDILGISTDRLSYQILLQDGRIGWVLAATSGARLDGDRAVVAVIVMTETSSATATTTPTPTSTPTADHLIENRTSASDEYPLELVTIECGFIRLTT